MREIRVFVSSPGDTRHERRRVDRVLARLNGEYAGAVRLVPVLWEDRFYSAHESFQPQIPEAADCDIVIAVFRARLGTPLPESFPHRMASGEPYPSGTAYEVLSAIARRQAADLPDVFVFRQPSPPSAPVGDPETRRIEAEWARLLGFFRTWFERPDGEFRAAFHS